MKIRELLFPTDFSPASEAAGRVAREAALAEGARLRLVHVLTPLTDPAAAAARLTQLVTALGQGLAVETALLSGRPAQEIVSYARDKGVDLIVIGTHGRTGFSRRLLGSVAEAVIRTAPCLVLTVPSGSAPGAAAPVETHVPPALSRCIVCAKEADELICDTCRAHIRGEALEQKLDAERAGRRGARA